MVQNFYKLMKPLRILNIKFFNLKRIPNFFSQESGISFLFSSMLKPDFDVYFAYQNKNKIIRVKIECGVDVPSRIGESPVWDSRTQTLLWVDIPVGIIHRFTPADGKHQQIEHGEKIGSFALRENGGLLIAGDSGLQTFDLETGARTILHHPEPDMTMNRFNDGVTDNQGRFWVGTMKDNKDVRGTAPEPTGRFYRFDPDGTCMPWKDNIYTPNGMTFSPDGKRMYFADSFPERRTC